MAGAALTHVSGYAQVRIREPAGERTLGETPTIGGTGADVVIPGTGPGGVLRIERRSAVWIAQPLCNTPIRFDGRPFEGARDLRRHDVLSVGHAQIVVTDVSRTLLRLEVCHLVGNATVAPTDVISTVASVGGGDEEVAIRTPAAPGAHSSPASAVPSGRSAVTLRVTVAAVAALLVLLGLYSLLVPLTLDIQPGDARVRVPGTLLAVRVGARLFVLPGDHVIRAEHKGYLSAGTQVRASRRRATGVRLHLIKLPGTLQIDTGGVAATVTVDGAEAGYAPGAITVAPGEHTITIRAPRHVVYTVAVEIAGALARQHLTVALQPSWGTLQITTVPAGARVVVDGLDSGVAPTVVDAPSGVRRVRISAPGLKTWESSVVLEAGEALDIGPITLGQPDAHLSLASDPGGAEVLIAGIFRGRTPIEADLPAGIPHEVVVEAPGYATWKQAVFAEAGRHINLMARLQAMGARVTVQGEPQEARLIVDGVDRGRTPLSLLLSGVEHHIEVRKEGWVPFSVSVTPTSGLDRIVHYQLGVAEHSLAPAEFASTLYTQTGYIMRLVSGSASVARVSQHEHAPSAPSQPGRTERPLYFGVTEVSNEQFRRFHPNHTSGVLDRVSMDAGDQPVRHVTWNDAAAFCNWLSRQDSLPPAYEMSGDHYVLREPATIGYRLPTSVEWETAAHAAVGLGLHEMSAGRSEWMSDEPAGPGGTAEGMFLGFRVVRYAE